MKDTNNIETYNIWSGTDYTKRGKENMIKLKYELKTEEFEENEETIETKMIEITAETDHPSTRIVFEKSSKPLAETLTNNEGIAICGFTPQSRKCIVKATCNEETSQITVPKLTDLNEEDDD